MHARNSQDCDLIYSCVVRLMRNSTNGQVLLLHRRPQGKTESDGRDCEADYGHSPLHTVVGNQPQKLQTRHFQFLKITTKNFNLYIITYCRLASSIDNNDITLDYHSDLVLIYHSENPSNFRIRLRRLQSRCTR